MFGTLLQLSRALWTSRSYAQLCALAMASLCCAAPSAAAQQDGPASPRHRGVTEFDILAGWENRSPPALGGRAPGFELSSLSDGQLGLAAHTRRIELDFDLLLSADGAAQLEHGGLPVGPPLAPDLAATEVLSCLGDVALTAGRWHRVHVRADDMGLLITVDGLPVSREAPLPQAAPLILRQLSGTSAVANLRLRDLADLPGRLLKPLASEGLRGWTQLGDAVWTPGPDEVFGEVGGGAQSFLVSEQSFGDFLLEVELRNEDQGNSGIQVRSQLTDGGRLFGYQIEIDPSDRAWSGGLYDEARRGWIDNLADDDVAQAAFRHGEWNHYRIECVGPSIKAWVNGLPTADVLDTLDLSGRIALQIHSGHNSSMRWRHLRLTDLGRHRWLTWLDAESMGEWLSGRPGWRPTADGLMPHESASPRAPALLLSPTTVPDTALQLSYRSSGQLALILAVPAETLDEHLLADPAPRPAGPGLHDLPHGGLLVRPPATDGWATLSVSLAGGRLAVHIDGALLGERRDGITSPRQLTLLAEGPDCTVAQLERLSPADG